MKSRCGPDGIHLFDRETGLNLLLDEISVPEKLWACAPRQVSIALTNACDLHCPFCYAPKHPAVLDVEKLRRWLDELDNAGCLGVGFGGGEPTLYRRLIQVCRYANEHTGLAITMTTHGHRWTPELVDALHGSVDFVRVSVDGVGTAYEQLRGRSFTDLLTGVELIAAAFRFGVNCVVNDATLPHLDAVAELAAQAGAAELLLLPERAARGRNGADQGVIDRVHQWVSRYPGPLPIMLGEGDTGPLPVAVPLPKETGLRAYAHIDASGTLRRTSFDPVSQPVDDRGMLAALYQLQRMETAA